MEQTLLSLKRRLDELEEQAAPPPSPTDVATKEKAAAADAAEQPSDPEVPADVVRLTEDDFYLPRFRYVAPRPYTREEYEHLHDWMKDWGLLKPESGYDSIVNAELTASAR